MPSKPKIGIVAICDEVYKDAGTNKIIIAGLYSGNIVSSGPRADVQLAAYIEIFLTDTNQHELELSVEIEKKKFAGTKSTIYALDTTTPVAILLQKFSLQGSLPATLTLKMSLDGGPNLKILEKRIVSADSSKPQTVPIAQ